MKNLKVIIACGSGAVTSTMCAEIVRNLAKDNGITVMLLHAVPWSLHPRLKIMMLSLLQCRINSMRQKNIQ